MPSMWFGTRGYESWVKMPKPDVESPYVGRVNRNDQINGGVSVDASAAAHKEYALEWNGRIDEMQEIADYLDGVYTNDANGGLIYFIDPSASTRNHLPKLWASPYLCGLDGPSLTKGTRPTLSATAGSSLKLPARTATFTVGTTTPTLTLYVPIPSGHEARWAFYGPTAQSSRIRVTPYVAGAATTPTDNGILANTAYGTGLTTTSGVDGVEFTLTPNSGSVTLTAGLLLIVPTGYIATAPTTFVSGRGHSGCVVDSNITHTINAAHDDINWATLAAHLVERGSWL